jgi:hypothetical protein
VTLFGGTHPEPGADLGVRKPILYELNPGANLFRFHSASHKPLYFGKAATFRFDDPDAQFGVMYAGLDIHCAFIETFGQATGMQTVYRRKLAERTFTKLTVTRTLRLIDLCTTGGLARIGADAGLCSGRHATAQRWSAALRSHPTKPDGILYPARHDPSRSACAIFDCAMSTFKTSPQGSLLDKQNLPLLASLLDTYSFGLVP